MDPDSSAIGSPIGEKAVKSIGPDGGKISSADGMMELVFPAGALTTMTEISVQPIENKAATGLGSAYACEPDGTHFQKPVQLRIHYSDSTRKKIAPAFRNIIWQDNEGRWTRVEKVEVDSVSRTVACNILHFSRYSTGTDFTVVSEHPVRVGTFRMYRLIISGVWPDGRRHPSTDRVGRDQFWKAHQVEWYVDGIQGGNEQVGTIEFSEFMPTPNYTIYYAPSTLPATDPEITAEYIGTWQVTADVTADNAKASVPADLYDEFHYSFTGFDMAGRLHMVDSATCDIRVEASGAVKLTNIRNPIPWSDYPPTLPRDLCSYVYPDKLNWKGTVQIAGMTSAKCFPATAAGDAPISVIIRLVPTMGGSPPAISTCHGRKKYIPSLPIIASPTYIQFEAGEDGGILITYGSASGRGFIDTVKNDQGFVISMSRAALNPSQ